MTEIIWKKRYSIGVVEIDNQHKKLFEMLHGLQGSLNHSITNPVIGKTLRELVEYTQVHFRDEEKLMRQIKYNDYDNHQKMHRDLIIEVKEILLRLKNGDDITAIDLIGVLKHWLEEHILNEDMKVGKVLQERIQDARSGLTVEKVH